MGAAIRSSLPEPYSPPSGFFRRRMARLGFRSILVPLSPSLRECLRTVRIDIDGWQGTDWLDARPEWRSRVSNTTQEVPSRWPRETPSPHEADISVARQQFEEVAARDRFL